MPRNVHERTLATALVMPDALSEEGRAKAKSAIPLEAHLRLLRQGKAGIYRDEIIASRLMKQLTARFGTRGKTPKFIFLQAFEDELRGGSSSETEHLKSIGHDKTYWDDEKDIDDKDDQNDNQGKIGSSVEESRKLRQEKENPQPKTMTDLLTMRHGHLGPLVVRRHEEFSFP